jgi:hypothetical protein
MPCTAFTQSRLDSRLPRRSPRSNDVPSIRIVLQTNLLDVDAGDAFSLLSLPLSRSRHRRAGKCISALLIWLCAWQRELAEHSGTRDVGLRGLSHPSKVLREAMLKPIQRLKHPAFVLDLLQRLLAEVVHDGYGLVLVLWGRGQRLSRRGWDGGIDTPSSCFLVVFKAAPEVKYARACSVYSASCSTYVVSDPRSTLRRVPNSPAFSCSFSISGAYITFGRASLSSLPFSRKLPSGCLFTISSASSCLVLELFCLPSGETCLRAFLSRRWACGCKAATDSSSVSGSASTPSSTRGVVRLVGRRRREGAKRSRCGRARDSACGG